MTDQELRKLKKPQILEIMIRQGRAVTTLQEQVQDAQQRQQEAEKEAARLEQTLERLKKKLDDKDAEMAKQEEVFQRLKHRLDEKDALISALRLELEQERAARETHVQEAANLEEATLRLKCIFEDARRAADQYLEKVHGLERKEPGHES